MKPDARHISINIHHVRQEIPFVSLSSAHGDLSVLLSIGKTKGSDGDRCNTLRDCHLICNFFSGQHLKLADVANCDIFF